MKRQQAFIDAGRMLKGGLHCHTVRSDGKQTPKEVLAVCEKLGYDFYTISDHRVYNFKNFLPESQVLVIPGMEYDSAITSRTGSKCYHSVCIGPAKEDGNGFSQGEIFNPKWMETPEDFQSWLDYAHQMNNLTIYCHPQWSSTPARYFENLKGNFAMEIWNTTCARKHECDNDAAYWDELLGQGKVLYGVAVDDAHSEDDVGGGWVMVNAEKNINSILTALKNGAFYSSCGPQIYDFYVDRGRVYVDCSPVAKVRLHSDGHPCRIMRHKEGRMTHAEFNMVNCLTGSYGYVRISVVDMNGNKAWTNPIFLDEP